MVGWLAGLMVASVAAAKETKEGNKEAVLVLTPGEKRKEKRERKKKVAERERKN